MDDVPGLDDVQVVVLNFEDNENSLHWFRVVGIQLVQLVELYGWPLPI